MTATRSPTARPSTSDPNASITPAASTPSCAGKVALVADFPDLIRTSPRFRPIALIRKQTSLGPGSGTTTSSIFRTSGPPNSWNRTLRDIGLSPDRQPSRSLAGSGERHFCHLLGHGSYSSVVLRVPKNRRTLPFRERAILVGRDAYTPAHAGGRPSPSPSLLALLLELTGLEVASPSMLRSPPPRRRRRYGRDPRQQIRYAASPICSGEIGMGGSPARAPCQKRRLPLPRSPVRAKFR